jgi:hypothetical protein
MWAQLEQVLPAEQREQLAELLLGRIAHGWGIIKIVVQNHYVKEFRDEIGITARRGKTIAKVEN